MRNRIDAALARHHREYVEAAESSTRVTRVTVTVSTTTFGEATVDVAFPVKFVETPAFFHGGIFTGTPTAGAMPVYSCIVLEWIKDIEFDDLFAGATLGISTAGTLSNPFDIQAHFEGMAFNSVL